MKKTYQAPRIKTVFIATTLMNSVSGTLDSNQSITSSDDFGSRRSSIWDNDEEED